MSLLRILERRRMPVDHALQKLVDNLKHPLGNRLKSVVIFGSMASGEFREGHSDVNVLVVLDKTTFDDLTVLSPALQPWRAEGHPTPILVGHEELPVLSRSHPIEFLDMTEHHRVLAGEDPLAGLSVDTRALRYQCEHDLSLLVLKLRQAAALEANHPKRLRSALIDSLPSALVLFRAVLRLQGAIPRTTKMEAAEKLASLIGFDALTLRKILELHLQRSSDDITGIWNDYFAILQKVIGYLSK